MLVNDINPAKWVCEHRHNGYEHPNCFRKALPSAKIFLDIESGNNLAADFGFIISWCIKKYGEDKFYGDILNVDDYKNGTDRDKRIVTSLVTTLNEFSLSRIPYTLYTFYGNDRKFDMPFARSRALMYGLQFPTYGSMYQVDMYTVAKNKLKLHNGRLDSIQEAFHLKTEKTKIDIEYWQKATFGYNNEALNYIWDHNKKDTIVLEEVYNLLEPYFKSGRTSV